MTDRVIVFARGFFAIDGLQKLVETGVEVVACVPAKYFEGECYLFNELIRFCKREHIPIREDAEEQECVAVCIGWNRFVPLDNFERVIVFHDSLLPRYQGFLPLIEALINGDNEIGWSVFEAEDDDVPDKGLLLGQYVLETRGDFRFSTVVNNMRMALGYLISEVVFKGKFVTAQIEQFGQVTYSPWRDYDDLFIDWSWNEAKIKRFVDVLSFPMMGAKTWLNNCAITIEKIELVPSIKVSQGHQGKIIRLDKNCPIVCGNEHCLKIIDARVRDKDNANIGKRFTFDRVRIRLR